MRPQRPCGTCVSHFDVFHRVFSERRAGIALATCWVNDSIFTHNPVRHTVSRVRNIIESEYTFGAFMLVFWFGAMLFTMSSHLAVYNLN